MLVKQNTLQEKKIIYINLWQKPSKHNCFQFRQLEDLALVMWSIEQWSHVHSLQIECKINKSFWISAQSCHLSTGNRVLCLSFKPRGNTGILWWFNETGSWGMWHTRITMILFVWEVGLFKDICKNSNINFNLGCAARTTLKLFYKGCYCWLIRFFICTFWESYDPNIIKESSDLLQNFKAHNKPSDSAKIVKIFLDTCLMF